jgi:hypothetical protein
MTKIIKSIVLSSVAVLSGSLSANAAVLDFTALSTFTSATYANETGASGSINGVTWTVTASPAQLRYNMPKGSGDLTGADKGYDGTAKPSDELAFVGDGLGIKDDEVTKAKSEYLTLTFSKAVKVKALHFLDLFYSRMGIEQVDVSGDLTALISSDQELQPGTGGAIGGYKKATIANSGPVFSITFRPTATTKDGDDGSADFSLAAVEIAAIPLPAGGILLLTALGGLAAVRRRKSL